MTGAEAECARRNHPLAARVASAALVTLAVLAAPAAAQDRDWKRVLTGAGVAAAGGYVLYTPGNAPCDGDLPQYYGREVGQPYLAQYNPLYPDLDLTVLSPERCRSTRQLAAGASLLAAGAVISAGSRRSTCRPGRVVSACRAPSDSDTRSRGGIVRPGHT